MSRRFPSMNLGVPCPDDGSPEKPLNGRSVCQGCRHSKRLVYRDLNLEGGEIHPPGEEWRETGEPEPPKRFEIHRAMHLCLHPLLEAKPQDSPGPTQANHPLMSDVASCELFEARP